MRPGLPGSHQLPGLRTLALTQPVREGLGLGLGQASPGAANQTGTAVTPPPPTRPLPTHPGSRIATDHPLPGRSGCSRARTARLADRTPHKTHRGAEPALLESFIWCCHRGRGPEPGAPPATRTSERAARSGAPGYHPRGVRSVEPGAAVAPSRTAGPRSEGGSGGGGVDSTPQRQAQGEHTALYATEEAEDGEELDLRAGRWTNLREGGVSPKQRNPGRKHTKCRGNRWSNSGEKGLLFSFPF